MATTAASADRRLLPKRIDNTAVLFEGGYTHGHELQNNGDVGGYSTSTHEADPADYNQRNGLFKIRQYTDVGHLRHHG